MTDRETFENWWKIEPPQGAPFDDENGATKYWAEQAWQARGRLDAKRIAELEEYIEVDCTQVIQNYEEQNNQLSLQNQVLREALETGEKLIEEISILLMNAGIDADAINYSNDSIFKKALSTTPNQDEWIKRSELEIASMYTEHVYDPLYRIKETTK